MSWKIGQTLSHTQFGGENLFGSPKKGQKR